MSKVKEIVAEEDTLKKGMEAYETAINSLKDSNSDPDGRHCAFLRNAQTELQNELDKFMETEYELKTL